MASFEQTYDEFHEKDLQVFWGGPDCPPRQLRNILEKKIHAVPAGGEILWITYYFRDTGLAQALLQARQRGVMVQVLMERTPRTKTANDKVKRLLATLGRNLRVLNHTWILKRSKKSRLHEKLYYFSHPAPHVLVGTFNPSGDSPEDPVIIREIGDQDRGHNLLVKISDQILVQALHTHARRLFQMAHGKWERFLPESNRIISSGRTRIIFFPRWSNKEFYRLFSELGVDSKLRIAVSHLNDPEACKHLIKLAHQGINLEIITHDTERRVPAWVEEEMRENNVNFKRYTHPEGLPMHNKFMLIDTPKAQSVVFGSMNLSVRSLHANHELLVISKDQALYQDFSQRWEKMQKEVMISQLKE
ncbi:MAG: phosphatidylserine/phosphatidylglycerophosphate/cardiolipin synthase family protein [Desulfuromusa sp.]|nr:phosphatidylserine/phosphatidylglycerophosphate/cardiolipin synthase family protein [Desulfuromusa sp.]